MNKRRLTIRLEQWRQARRIHGGFVQLGVALLGIRLARMTIPSKRLRLRIYRNVYGKKYPPGLDENEADRPLWEYRSLNALFTRGIKPQYRPINRVDRQFVSPCDGTIQEIGRLYGNKLLTLKGIEYTLDSLLPGVDTTPFQGGQFATVFLSPIHCHRVFSPHDGCLEQAIHVPGYRLLVHPPYQHAAYPVYTLNERVIMCLSTAMGPCLLILVAGWGVGNITLRQAPDFCPPSRLGARRTWSPAARVQRGEWLATFELGSTAVLITSGAANMLPLVSANDEVKYGQPILGAPG
jgi:phosphatidylserine decarboxylase